ncbi:hypothetical protein [Flavobacterium daemonense]|uniref:hypothetical protein n=1 Tax=Flavobacterium daemonense TaxID=1393049 RepID=UPI0011856CAB|nr:hypothetical protein [Flavobacterium daemonense]KAF2328190.1 hypothetical protein FND99_17750 [Flavobacterium daemonense]
MKQNEYNIKILSRNRLICIMVLILCSSTIFLKNYTPKIENKILAILQFTLIYATSFYIANLVATAKATVILTNDGILHIWKRRFFLSWEKDIKIPWNNVDNYSFESDRTCDSIIVNLKNKTKYKIEKLNILPINDDFKKLQSEFLKLRERSNEKTTTANSNHNGFEQ